MSDDGETYGFTGHIRRFFRLPPEEKRWPAPGLPLFRVGLLAVAAKAGLTGLGWEDMSWLAVLTVVFAMVDDVIKGVRHRWPALVAGAAAGWGAGAGVNAGSYGGMDSAWVGCLAFGVGGPLALAIFAAVTRLPDRVG